MSLRGLTMIIGGESRTADPGHHDLPALPPEPLRLQLVVKALAAGASASRLAGAPTARNADRSALVARRAAVAAALQEWSGVSRGTFRSSVRPAPAASRAACVRQEATRASHHPYEETVFEAFSRGVEGHPVPQLRSGWGGRQ